MKKVLFLLAISLFTASFTMAQTPNSKGKKQGTTQTTNNNNGSTVTNSGNSSNHCGQGQTSSCTKTSKGKKKGTKKK